MIRLAALALLPLLAACASAAPPGAVPPAAAPPGQPPGPATARATIVITRADDSLAFNDSTRAALLPAAAGIQWRVDPSGFGALTSLGDSLLVTRERTIIDFASASERFIVTPLRWDLTYLLVARSPHDLLPVEGAGVDQLRRDLASNAVRISARPAGLLYWWNGRTPCDSSIAAAARLRPAVGYPADDPTAGLIASRLAAVASSSADLVVAEPLAQRELGFALADGRLAGVVMPIGTTAGSELPSSLACNATLTPLIDVRAHLIHRVLP
jgi:hypothetical protein